MSTFLPRPELYIVLSARVLTSRPRREATNAPYRESTKNIQDD
jgi:hypothetical protein